METFGQPFRRGRRPAPSDRRRPAPSDGRRPAPSDRRRGAPGDGRRPAPGDGRRPAPGNGRRALPSSCVNGEQHVVERHIPRWIMRLNDRHQLTSCVVLAGLVLQAATTSAHACRCPLSATVSAVACCRPDSTPESALLPAETCCGDAPCGCTSSGCAAGDRAPGTHCGCNHEIKDPVAPPPPQLAKAPGLAANSPLGPLAGIAMGGPSTRMPCDLHDRLPHGAAGAQARLCVWRI